VAHFAKFWFDYQFLGYLNDAEIVLQRQSPPAYSTDLKKSQFGLFFDLIWRISNERTFPTPHKYHPSAPVAKNNDNSRVFIGLRNRTNSNGSTHVANLSGMDDFSCHLC
jgi:hypothetical protein